jgi:hypothetical protein
LKTNKRDNLLTWLLTRALYFQIVEHTWWSQMSRGGGGEMKGEENVTTSSSSFVDVLAKHCDNNNVRIIDAEEKEEEQVDFGDGAITAMAHTRLCVNADDVRNVILMRCFETYLGSAFRSVFGSAAAYHTGGGGGEDGACKFWLKDANNGIADTCAGAGVGGGGGGGMARQNWTVVETLFHNCCCCL